MTLDKMAGAVAIQISDVPACAFARLTRLQVRPAPLTLSVCPPDKGPSEAANARTVAPGDDVLKTGVLMVPLPSAETTWSTVTAACAVVGNAMVDGTTMDAESAVIATGDPAHLNREKNTTARIPSKRRARTTTRADNSLCSSEAQIN